MISFNVPNLPGVPRVARSTLSSDFQSELLMRDMLSGLLGGAGGLFAGNESQWGIFKNGSQVISAESVITVDLKKDWALSDYPIEKGGFADYDKVTIPFQARVRFASGADASTRQALLDSIDAIAGDLEMYEVVTAEKVYSTVNINAYDFRREATRGVGLVQVDVQLTEVRETAVPAAGSATAEADGAGEKSGGTVQGITPTSADKEAVIGKQPTNMLAYNNPSQKYTMPNTMNTAITAPSGSIAGSSPIVSSFSFTPAVQSKGISIGGGDIGSSFGMRTYTQLSSVPTI